MSFSCGTFSFLSLVLLSIFSFPLVLFHNIHSCYMDMIASKRTDCSFLASALCIGAGLRSIARVNINPKIMARPCI